MEADRLRSLDVSQPNLTSERDVVKEERRQRVDTPPFGRLFEVVLDNSYTTHPYQAEQLTARVRTHPDPRPRQAPLREHNARLDELVRLRTGQLAEAL